MPFVHTGSKYKWVGHKPPPCKRALITIECDIPEDVQPANLCGLDVHGCAFSTRQPLPIGLYRAHIQHARSLEDDHHA